MREALFIKKNKSRWERIQKNESADPDEVAKDFIQLVDDLSYAKTFYPKSRVTKYINTLASRIYLGIYQNRRDDRNRLGYFWKYDVPLTVYKHGKIVLFSFFIFFSFYAIGFFSSQQDETFIRQVFGDRYVDTTEKNIASGNPFGIYQSGTPFFNWVGIMINNIIVSFMYFVKGIFAGIFSLTSLAKESMRVGVFHFMFFEKGHGFAFILAVMIHGLLELTAIVIACAGGVIMGTSYLFPGTRSRLQAFREGVKDGVKIIIGLIPILIVAAFYEGYVTRHYKMPVLINLLMLGTSAAFVIWYFILYPIQLKKRKEVHG